MTTHSLSFGYIKFKCKVRKRWDGARFTNDSCIDLSVGRALIIVTYDNNIFYPSNWLGLIRPLDIIMANMPSQALNLL